MKQLNLNSFICCETDNELNQYRVLSGLKEFQNDFYHNRLYPSLAELVYLSSRLEEVLDKDLNFSNRTNKNRKNIIVKEKAAEIQILDEISFQNDYQLDLIEWALPKVKSLIEEAYILYRFVEDSMKIYEVGLPPLNKSEGYFIVPDNKSNLLEIHRYESSIYSSSSKPFHSMNTSFVKAAEPVTTIGQAELLKLELIRSNKDVPTIATYLFKTELDFPFNETIFPIAKRILLTHIA